MRQRISTWVATAARLGTVLAALLAAAASAGSRSEAPPAVGGNVAPAPSQAMEPRNALGLWRSSFGAVKIEEDLSRGQPGSGAVMGVWVYDRDGQEVIGYFAGNMRGNVLDFTWQEPAVPAPLQGAGYLLFDAGGTRFSGRWWTGSRDRSGDWTGWRQEAATQPQPQDQAPPDGPPTDELPPPPADG
jgi:hypothetical protein